MTHPKLEVLLSPAEFNALSPDQLANTTCVVFDVLRATTSMVTALAHGAQAILPVTDIPQALSAKLAHPSALLAGERLGLPITADQTNGIPFDLGNSPREFITPTVRDRLLIWTTTNGTRALRATHGATRTLLASFLNLTATATALRKKPPASLLIIGAGTYHEAALEDTLAAGALCNMLWDLYEPGHVADSALIARTLYQHHHTHLLDALAQSLNGRRLLKIPALKHDVAFAAQLDPFPIVVDLDADGFARIHP
jgi:2-phosphosulfolactate phosphatase